MRYHFARPIKEEPMIPDCMFKPPEYLTGAHPPPSTALEGSSDIHSFQSRPIVRRISALLDRVGGSECGEMENQEISELGRLWNRVHTTADQENAFRQRAAEALLARLRLGANHHTLVDKVACELGVDEEWVADLACAAMELKTKHNESVQWLIELLAVVANVMEVNGRLESRLFNRLTLAAAPFAECRLDKRKLLCAVITTEGWSCEAPDTLTDYLGLLTKWNPIHQPVERGLFWKRCGQLVREIAQQSIRLDLHGYMMSNWTRGSGTLYDSILSRIRQIPSALNTVFSNSGSQIPHGVVQRMVLGAAIREVGVCRALSEREVRACSGPPRRVARTTRGKLTEHDLRGQIAKDLLKRLTPHDFEWRDTLVQTSLRVVAGVRSSMTNGLFIDHLVQLAGSPDCGQDLEPLLGGLINDYLKAANFKDTLMLLRVLPDLSLSQESACSLCVHAIDWAGKIVDNEQQAAALKVIGEWIFASDDSSSLIKKIICQILDYNNPRFERTLECAAVVLTTHYTAEYSISLLTECLLETIPADAGLLEKCIENGLKRLLLTADVPERQRIRAEAKLRELTAVSEAGADALIEYWENCLAPEDGRAEVLSRILQNWTKDSALSPALLIRLLTVVEQTYPGLQLDFELGRSLIALARIPMAFSGNVAHSRSATVEKIGNRAAGLLKDESQQNLLKTYFLLSGMSMTVANLEASVASMADRNALSMQFAGFLGLAHRWLELPPEEYDEIKLLVDKMAELTVPNASILVGEH